MAKLFFVVVVLWASNVGSVSFHQQKRPGSFGSITFSATIEQSISAQVDTGPRGTVLTARGPQGSVVVSELDPQVCWVETPAPAECSNRAGLELADTNLDRTVVALVVEEGVEEL